MPSSALQRPDDGTHSGEGDDVVGDVDREKSQGSTLEEVVDAECCGDERQSGRETGEGAEHETSAPDECRERDGDHDRQQRGPDE